MYATVHIPEIFSVRELDQISIFRKPSDAISSLMNKHLEVSNYSSLDHLEPTVKFHEEMYRKYMSYAEASSEHIYIARFEDLTGNTIKHFENIAKRFDRPMAKDYESKFNSLSFNGKLWEDKYDGHIPREKDAERIKIEKVVSSLSIIKQLDSDYMDFLQTNATIL